MYATYHVLIVVCLLCFSFFVLFREKLQTFPDKLKSLQSLQSFRMPHLRLGDRWLNQLGMMLIKVGAQMCVSSSHLRHHHAPSRKHQRS